jgi:tetratricopeptide (TPR) repeat protein/class 3 adenylate cyclase
MEAESTSDPKFEVGHVLFIDIVGYSKLLINEQSEQVDLLSKIVRATDQARRAEKEGKLTQLPTGDGVALVFRTTPEAPARCALELSRALQSHPRLKVRMGVHSGPVNVITDVNQRANITGAGINIAQRVMDCGDGGHILLSRRAAEDLESYREWRSLLHDLGECEVKHGVRVGVVNLYTQTLGNPHRPQKIRQSQSAVLRPGSVLKAKHLIGGIALLLFVFGIVFWLVRAQRWQTAVIQKQGEQVSTIVDRYQKMQVALVQLAAVEARERQPGEKLTAYEQRGRAYAVLEKDLGLPIGSLAKELPAFALELYHREDTTPLMRAKAAYALDKFGEAEKLSLDAGAQDQQAYANAREVADERRKRAIDAFELAGQSAEKLIHYSDALKSFQNAAQLTDRSRDSLEWAKQQWNIANALQEQGQYAGAEKTYRLAAEEYEHARGPDDPDLLSIRTKISGALRLQGKYAQAEANERDVLERLNKVLGPEHPETLNSRMNLANVLHFEGKNADAEAAHREIIKVKERVLGPEHPDTLRSRNNLALTLYGEGKYAEAEVEHRTVLTLEEKVLGPEHPDTIKCRMNLGNTLDYENKYPEAEKEYRQVLQLDQKVLGPEHPDTLNNRNNLAVALRHEGKFTEAETEYRKVILAMTKVLGPEHPDTLGVRNNLANALDDEGKYAEAETEHRQIQDIRQRVFGANHPDTLQSGVNLAITVLHEGKTAEAEAELASLIKVEEKVLGPQHPDTLYARMCFAGALDSEGKYTLAESQLSQVVALYDKVSGHDDPDCLDARAKLADTLYHEEKYAEAETQFRDVIGTQSRILGPDHPRTIDSYYEFATALRNAGNFGPAKDLALQAVQRARKTLGPEHPNTKKYEKLLADLEAKH